MATEAEAPCLRVVAHNIRQTVPVWPLIAQKEFVAAAVTVSARAVRVVAVIAGKARARGNISAAALDAMSALGVRVDGTVIIICNSL